eukprot:CAMPEP_0115828126 /NCGR_PEP_ID=MMETSP0287-20121206/411_1 /TAXON_ID=412157 /ORGANISM="Chrysochromulina rotalis, Strain UIO044" /LENGTH=118 /DNA_ID=CAMNT_0003281329 /DNA_START=361 /DNA_END=717 /DNA_ORIENTATION=+
MNVCTVPSIRSTFVVEGIGPPPKTSLMRRGEFIWMSMLETPAPYWPTRNAPRANGPYPTSPNTVSTSPSARWTTHRPVTLLQLEGGSVPLARHSWHGVGPTPFALLGFGTLSTCAAGV